MRENTEMNIGPGGKPGPMFCGEDMRDKPHLRTTTGQRFESAHQLHQKSPGTVWFPGLFCVHGSFVLRRKGSERASPKAFLRRFYQPLCGLKKPVDPPGLWAEKSLNFSAWSRRVSEFDLAILSSCREKTAVI